MVNLTGLISTLGLGSVAIATAGVIKQDVRQNFGDQRVITLQTAHVTENVRQLLVDHYADHFGGDGHEVSVKLDPKAVEALENTGVLFRDSTEDWIAHFENNFNDPNFFCDDGPEACAARDAQAFYSNYQDADAIFARIDSIAGPSPVATVGSIGTSYEGRDLKLVEIGDQTKPLAFFMCNIHAREWLTPMYCSYMIETLVANGGHPLLDTFSFAIVPIGNPDGYTYSRNVNSLWRKTRMPNAGSSCVGTDPNRNYDNNWCGPGTSRNPCDQIYCGTAPFDQPETAALDRYASRADIRNRLITWVDFHSYASYWLSPLGYTTGTPPAVDYNRMEQCMRAATTAVNAVNNAGFRFAPAANALGAAAGASDDYFYFAYDVIYSYTVEMRGNSFQPPASNIDPSNREIFAGMVAQMECIAEIELGGSAPTPFPVASPVTTPTPPPTLPPTSPPTNPPVPCFFGFC